MIIVTTSGVGGSKGSWKRKLNFSNRQLQFFIRKDMGAHISTLVLKFPQIKLSSPYLCIFSEKI